ncbi:MAG: ParB N-terminal domain-containing protein [Flavobacterium sp.]
MKVKISEIKTNPNNPRVIKDDKFQKLVQSIKDFPEMLDIRPIVVNKDMIVLGGNMRLKACKEAGLKEVSIIKAEQLTEEQQREFIIKDNVGYGEWDWEMIANQWDTDELNEWSLDIPNFNTAKDLDYSILDEADISEQLEGMASNVKKAIQIEFEFEHYEEASELVKFWREQGLYIGGFLVEKLKDEKSKL